MQSMTQSLLLLSLLFVIDVSCRPSGSGVSFSRFCASIRYNYVYNKYEIALPFSVKGRHSGSLSVTPDASLTSKDSGLSVISYPKTANSGFVSFLCETFDRCQQLRIQLVSSPQVLSHAISFTNDHSQSRIFARLPSVSLVRNCNSGWKVFQQRVDGSLSFEQNYKTYERGFGQPKGNFWMGLHNLHAATAIGMSHSRCRLRIEAIGNDGRRYHAEFAKFEVQGTERHYQLGIEAPVSGNTMRNDKILYSNNGFFTTYDKDHDKLTRAPQGRVNCAQGYGQGGWWHIACYRFNPNAVYTRKNMNNYDFASFPTRLHVYQTLRRIRLMYKCI